MSAAIVIDPGGVNCDVTITGGNVYAAPSGGSAITFPQTVSAVTTYYSQDTSNVATRTVQIDRGGRTVFGPHADYVPLWVDVDAVTKTAQSVTPSGTHVTPYFGTAAAASTPGTVVKKAQAFAADGTSLGYVAIYDAIT